MQVIEDEVRKIGITANLKGYYYIQAAVELVLKNCFIQTKAIYVQLAKTFNKKDYDIEKNIRYAIKTTFDKNKFKAIETYNFGISDRTGLPTNSQFIRGIAREVLMKVDTCNQNII